MSAVPKPNDVLPIRPVETAPDEPDFDKCLSQIMAPLVWGKYSHSLDEQRAMWSRIWRCFQSEELCKGWVFWQKTHSMETWCVAFEQIRQTRQDSMKFIRYVKRRADSIVRDGTPQEMADREAAENEKAIKARNPMYSVVDPEDPDIKGFRERNNKVPQQDMANHPLTLKFKNLSRGEK